ncbi:MAG: VirB3 family type IV secretion system protein [Betaproteobacteria bacterium]|nr:VirB3 family type IV secretion system protein [Betaproteobacteria bacterium]MDE2423822.1 VirB3 family type IV secretion system protein [Betaproteobacteria bacterium]
MSKSQSQYQLVPLYRALNRPLLIMGGERHLSLMLIIVCGIFILSLPHLWSALVGVGLWVIGQVLIGEAARYDPQLSQITLRHLRFQRDYPARATPFARPSNWA